jgi:hypothetical protein
LISELLEKFGLKNPTYLKYFSLRDDYIEAIDGVMKLLVKRTSKSGLLFIGELQSGARDFKPKMV